MDQFIIIKDAFETAGMSEDSASRLAEHINDAGANFVLEVLKNLELNLE